jgi:exodeoxyribonuclease V gamma subunit
VPAFEQNSWRAGLRRLLLGYALRRENASMFLGILPFDDVEGSDARVLGCLAEFAEALFESAEVLERPRPLAGWSGALLSAFDRFFRPDEDEEREAQRIREELGRLAELAQEAAFEGEVSLRVVRSHLRGEMERPAFGDGYRPGRVTFAGLRALRSVPFRAVAMVGMNDGAFPRIGRAPGFDRIARNPRPGDPTARDEDRYVFLETILAAREKLYVSYVGRRVNDNQPVPPSVVVSELLDAVAEGFTHPEGDLPGAITTQHRLQPFSPDYFRPGTGISSFSKENLAGVRAMFGPVTALRRFVREPLPHPEDEGPDLDVAELARFFTHPTRVFLNRRLHIRLGEDTYAVEDREPFAVEGLERYVIEEDLTARVIGGLDLGQAFEVLRAEGRLPAGRPGEVAFAVLRGRVKGFVEEVRPWLEPAELEPLELDLLLEPFALIGRLGGVRADGLVRYRCAKVKGKDLIRAWVEHLALTATAADGYPTETLVLGTDVGYRLRRPDDPAVFLGELLELYSLGMREPLRFFPESSFEYAKCALDPGSAGRALSSARNKWEGTSYARGEGDDPYLRLALGGFDPFDAEFERVARAVGQPLHEHLEKL